MTQMFSAESAVRNEVMIILGDVLVKCDDGAVEAGIIDRDVAAFSVPPGAVLQLSLLELDCHLLGLQ